VQTNTSTHTKRRIRRLLLDGDGKITDASSLSEPSYPYHPPSLLENTDTFTIHQRQKSKPSPPRRHPYSLQNPPSRGSPGTPTVRKLQPSQKERKENKVARIRSTRSPNYPEIGEKSWKLITEPQPKRLIPSPEAIPPQKTYHVPLKKREGERRLMERKRTLSKERQLSKTPEKKARLPSVSPQRPIGIRDPQNLLFSTTPKTGQTGECKPDGHEEDPSPKLVTVTITMPPTQVKLESKHSPIVPPSRYYHVQYGGWTFEMHAMKKQIESLELKLNQESLSKVARYGFKKQMEVEKAKLNREIRRLQTEATRNS